MDLEDARRRIGLFIDHYNFQRPHQGIDGLVPADRFFKAAPEVLGTLEGARGGQALELARNERAREPFLLNRPGGRPGLQPACRGRAGDLTGADGPAVVDLVPPAAAAAELPSGPVCSVERGDAHAGREGRHQRGAAGPGHVAAGRKSDHRLCRPEQGGGK